MNPPGFVKPRKWSPPRRKHPGNRVTDPRHFGRAVLTLEDLVTLAGMKKSVIVYGVRYPAAWVVSMQALRVHGMLMGHTFLYLV